MAKSSKINSMAWVVLYSFTAIVDGVQIVIDFTGVGIAVSEIVEVLMIPALLGLFKIFGISIFSKPARLLSIFGVAAGDAITGGIAPFWCVDVWYIQRSVKNEEAGGQAAKALQQLNNAGARQPSNPGRDRQLNKDGTRQPSSHIAPRPIKTEDNPLAA